MFQVTIELDSHGSLPLYEQLYRYFTREIREGRIPSGEKLPSKRALCQHLHISPTTVETAYGLLLAEGYVCARARSGYYVEKLAELKSDPAAVPARAEPEPLPSRPLLDFSTSAVDTAHFPYSSWAKLNKEIVYANPELLQRGDRQGDPPLRRALAEFLQEYRGVQCAPEQILVGAGMEYLMGVLLQLLPRETVFAMEDPGYAAVEHAIRNAGRELRYIPLDREGMRPDALRESGAQLAYVTPAHQFPMGIAMPAGRRSQLLHWAGEQDGRYIIEDDYDSEFRHSGRPLPAMQSLDRGGRVIYTGSFSRSLAPSIRVAYLVLPPGLLERYRAMEGHSRSTVSRYEQAVLARFLSEGLYGRYLRRVSRVYRQRRDALCAALQQLPGVSISGSEGGIHLLLHHQHFSERELCQRAETVGIRLRGLGEYCRACAPGPGTVVLGYGGLADTGIEQAAQALAQAWS